MTLILAFLCIVGLTLILADAAACGLRRGYERLTRR